RACPSRPPWRRKSAATVLASEARPGADIDPTSDRAVVAGRLIAVVESVLDPAVDLKPVVHRIRGPQVQQGIALQHVDVVRPVVAIAHVADRGRGLKPARPVRSVERRVGEEWRSRWWTSD